MTSAPGTLLALRQLLLAHLPVQPAAVGIVGDPAHRGGYHCGADRVDSDDYSVVESSRDRTGLTDYACALDVGAFTVNAGGKRHTLASFSVWLVAQCRAGTADTRDIREVIYSPDGTTVRRWDRLGRRSSGDSSHRWHTHISWHRDAIKAGRDQTAVFRRYLTTIGLISGGVEAMFCEHGDSGQNVYALQHLLIAAGQTLTADGRYGDATAAAVKAVCGGDGTQYVGIHYARLHVAVARRYAGKDGAPGEPGPAGDVTVAQVVDQVAAELAARLAA